MTAVVGGGNSGVWCGRWLVTMVVIGGWWKCFVVVVITGARDDNSRQLLR